MYSTHDLCDASGFSYRQIDYYIRRGLLPAEAMPTIRARGSGTSRRWNQTAFDAAREILADLDAWIDMCPLPLSAPAHLLVGAGSSVRRAVAV